MQIALAPQLLLRRRLVRAILERTMLAVVGLLLVGIGLGLLSWLLLAGGIGPAAVPRNPFGITLRDAAPATSGIGRMLLLAQAHFYGALTTAVSAIKDDQGAITSLAGIGFLYGIFHAAGPGHGKGVISGYLVASKRSLWRGLTLSFSAALLQATVAVVLVGVSTAMLNVTATTLNSTARAIEWASFAGVSAMGGILVWWKAGQLAEILAVARGEPVSSISAHHDLPLPSAFEGVKNRREMVGVVIAAGIRPCSGAMILLVFALSQGLFVAGVVGAFSMALGTAITTGTLATIAVYAKATLLRLTAGSVNTGALIVASCELLAAAFILILGLVLLSGMWTGALPSAFD